MKRLLIAILASAMLIVPVWAHEFPYDPREAAFAQPVMCSINGVPKILTRAGFEPYTDPAGEGRVKIVAAYDPSSVEKGPLFYIEFAAPGTIAHGHAGSRIIPSEDLMRGGLYNDPCNLVEELLSGTNV